MRTYQVYLNNFTTEHLASDKLELVKYLALVNSMSVEEVVRRAAITQLSGTPDLTELNYYWELG